MSMFRRHDRKVPGLNTASLPDLIFTVLFFFMIVTHMREVQLKVKFQVPQGTKLEKLTKKSVVTYLYVGQPLKGGAADGDTGESQIQINDKIASLGEVSDYLTAERQSMSGDDAKRMMVSIKADRKTHMNVIHDIKQTLRSAHVLKVNYSAEREKK